MNEVIPQNYFWEMRRIYTVSLNCSEIKEYSYNTHLMQMDVIMSAEKIDGIFGKKP